MATPLEEPTGSDGASFAAARRLFMRAEYDEREGRVGPDALRRRLEDMAPVVNVVHALLRLPALPRGARVVDVGTGAGTFALATAAASPRVDVLGTDLAPRAVAAATDAARALGLPNVRFAVADFEADPVPAADGAIIAYALSLAEDPSGVLKRAADALKPGARLVVFDAYLPPRVEPAALTPARLDALAAGAGLAPRGRADVTAIVQAIVARGAWPWSNTPDPALRFVASAYAPVP